MLQPVTLPLLTPVEWHMQMVKEITIKPPSSRIYLKYGDPRIWMRTNDGATYAIDKDEVICKYINEMVFPDGMLFLEQLDFVDSKSVKGAVLGFFDRADVMIYEKNSGRSSST